MGDGLIFKPVKIKDIGGGRLVKRLEKELFKASVLVSDERKFGPKAKARVTLTFDVIAIQDRHNPGGVVIAHKWAVRPPQALSEALLVFVRDGELKSQNTDQLDLEDIQRQVRESAEMDGDDDEPDEPDTTPRKAPGRSPKAQRPVVDINTRARKGRDADPAPDAETEEHQEP